MLLLDYKLKNFVPWSGAVDFYNELKESNLLEDLETLLLELYPNGITKTGINDLLWFEEDFIRESLGLEEEEE